MNRILGTVRGAGRARTEHGGHSKDPRRGGGTQVIARSFGTTTADLLGLRDWLQSLAVTHVAMESTGVYWKPDLLRVGGWVHRAARQRPAPQACARSEIGRANSAWIAQLLENELLRGSFLPPVPIRDLRDLTRYRKKQIQDAPQDQPLAEGLGGSGLEADLGALRHYGVSGRAMVKALAGGTTDPAVIADLARGRTRESAPPCARRSRAGSAHITPSARADPREDRLLEEVIADAGARIGEQLTPFVAPMARLRRFPA